MDLCFHNLFHCWLRIRKQIGEGNQYFQAHGSIVIKYKNIGRYYKESHIKLLPEFNLNRA